METKKKEKQEVKKEAKKKPRGSGFDCPTEGVIVPDDVVLKKNKDGTYSYYTPDGKKWKY